MKTAIENRITRRALVAGGASLLAAGPALAQIPNVPYYEIQQAQQSVVNTAYRFVDKTVGDGECGTFVAAVLDSLSYPHSGYVWGKPIPKLQYGCVIQMTNAKWEAPVGNGEFHTDTQHTAIVLGGSGGMLDVIHQNWGVKKVIVSSLNMNWKMTRGKIEFYQPGPWGL